MPDFYDADPTTFTLAGGKRWDDPPTHPSLEDALIDAARIAGTVGVQPAFLVVSPHRFNLMRVLAGRPRAPLCAHDRRAYKRLRRLCFGLNPGVLEMFVRRLIEPMEPT